MVRFNKSLFLLFLLLLPANLFAADMEITPFRTTNQSPLAMIHPLPAESSSATAPKGRLFSSLTFDLASSYSFSSAATEAILLDGESYKWTLSTRYGLTDSVEVGIELPWVTYGGGFLDSFIIGWHDAFGLPQGGRKAAVKNRIRYRYVNSGMQRIQVDSFASGLGDMVLTGGMKLYDEKSPSAHDTFALRSTIKLPTGESDKLLGSGAAGGALSICGTANRFTDWGSLALFGSAGGMLSDRGRVLHDQQESAAAFGTIGFGWGPASWISFKIQLNANTPLYRGSTLAEVSKPAFMLVSGGALKLPDDYQLDIGVSEDVSVGTAPDVAFHFSLGKLF